MQLGAACSEIALQIRVGFARFTLVIVTLVKILRSDSSFEELIFF